MLMREDAITDPRKNITLLVLIVIVAGICKISVFLMVYTDDPSRIFSPDSASYVNTARAFLKTGRFAISPDRPDSPQVVRTPGYPFFIASIFFVFGDEKYPPLIITQLLLSLGTIIVTYRIVALIWGANVAVVSALLLTLDLPSFISSQQVLTETLFTFVLSVAIFSVIYTLRKPQHVVFLAVSHGVFLSFAILIRPIAYYLIVPIIVTFVLILRTSLALQWRKIGIAVMMLIIPWIILVGGWKLRNYSITGKAEFSYIQGVNLLFYRGADIIAQRDGIPFNEARQHLGYENYREVYPETRNWSNAQLSQHWKREGLRLICQYPGLFLKSQIWGAVKMMLGPGEHTFLAYVSDYREETGPGRDFFKLPLNVYMQKWIIDKTGFFIFFLLAENYLILLYSSIIFSLWQLIRAKKDSSSGYREKKNEMGIHLFIWILILYFIAISAGPEAYSRFRVPIMPLLSIYAGHGIYQIVRVVREWRHATKSSYERVRN